MTVEKAIWTTLPYGFDGEGRLRVSVHVAPRLLNADGKQTQRKLGEFPAFEQWADRVNDMKFRVEFMGGPTTTGKRDVLADEELWGILFPPETTVFPREFQDHATRDIHIFPVSQVLDFLEKVYGAAGAIGTDLPSIGDPAGPLSAFVPLGNIPAWISDRGSFSDELTRAHKHAGQKEKPDGQVVTENIADAGIPPEHKAAQNIFFRAYRFYHRPGPGTRGPDFLEDYVEPPPPVPEFDFHQIVSSLSDHPRLLRRLGLVVDLVLDIDAGQVPPEGVVRVVPQGPVPEDPPTCPGTWYELDGSWFGARPKHKYRIERGLLRLLPDLHDLFQVDVDGAALQAVDFGATLAALLDPDLLSEATPSEAGLPALRSAGLAIARKRRGSDLLQDLKERRDKNEDIETGQAKSSYGISDIVAFDAEDLVRGYRIDTFDEKSVLGPRWFTLHERVSEHSIKGPDGNFLDPITVEDEGYLKGTTASSENKEHPTPSDDLYLHETLFGWEGWSLSASLPGKRIVEPGEGDGNTSIERYDPDKDNPFPITSRISVADRSLPRLRIGHTYRFRARTVDLAGNSRPFSEEDLEPPDPNLVSEAHRYRRFEPVPSPTVLRRHIDTEGESLEHLVMRSNVDVTAAKYASSSEVKADLKKAGALHSYAADSQRHLAPPKASQQMAEQDGMFDGGFGQQGDPTTALRVALREEGTFLEQTIVDAATGQKTQQQAQISLHPSTTLFPARGAALPDGAYSYYPDDAVVLPYLPDPMASGVSITGYDYTGAEVFHEVALFPSKWPKLVPFRLRLSQGPKATAKFTNGILEVRLPQAEVIWSRLASVFPGNRLDDLAIWNWIPAPDRTAELKKAALAGRHVMLTPFRRVTFTHATQQPLTVPNMTKVLPWRSLGSTFAGFTGTISNHAKSTGRLDVFGEWTEDVDILTDDEPKMRRSGNEIKHSGHAFGFEISRSEGEASVASHGARHEFGDTKYRRVTYHSVATTRFREFLPRTITDDPTKIQRIEQTKDANDNTKPGLQHHVLSTARPAAPQLLYVLPTFRWEKEDEAAKRTHIRHGKAVRVWLARPWFSSGDDEQLAVVLEPSSKLPPGWARKMSVDIKSSEKMARYADVSTASRRVLPRSQVKETKSELESGMFAGLADMVGGIAIEPEPSPDEARKMYRPYVTDWGSDPVWESDLPELPPTALDFPRRTGIASDLTLEELPSSLEVVAAPHEVYFDRGRKLWYCDIEIDAGDSYFPFVRLALARYQAHSLPGAHLSRVVMSDFMQLAPDRTAQVVPSEGSVEVTVKGFSGRNILANIAPPALSKLGWVGWGALEKRPNTEMRVALERRSPGVPGDLGWQRVGEEVELHGSASGFFMTWTGSVKLPAELEGSSHRLVITEVETYFRDLMAGDPMYSSSPLDFVRERVVYADVFEL